MIRIPPGAPNAFTSFGTLITSGRQVTSGADGTLWATGDKVINFTTAGTQVAGSPYDVGGVTQGIAAGPAPQVAYGNPNSTPQSIGRITPPGSPELTNLGNVDAGFGMTFGNDGAYWFGQYNGNNLGRLTPEGDYTTLEGFPAVPNRGPRQVTKGPDNTLWVTLDVPGDASNDAVARVTGVVAEEPPPNGPSCNGNDISFGKVKKNKEKGTAKLTLIVPCPGAVELAATKKVKGDEETAAAAGEVKLDIKPKGKAKQKLQPEGKAKVSVEVSFTPTGGEPHTESMKLKLVKRR